MQQSPEFKLGSSNIWMKHFHLSHDYLSRAAAMGHSHKTLIYFMVLRLKVFIQWIADWSISVRVPWKVSSVQVMHIVEQRVKCTINIFEK